MKAKDIIRFIGLIIIILFFALYFSTMGGYYQYNNSQKSTLTEEAIKRFEQDVKDGKEIQAKNYIKEEINYNNTFSKAGLNISNLIQKGFNKLMTKIFKELEQVVNS